MEKEYDVIIIGAGPAGLAAGIYCGRAGLKTLILEKIAVGGQPLIYGDPIENYPGFQNGIPGAELVEKMRKQAERFKAEFMIGEATGIILEPQGAGRRSVAANTGETYSAKAIIIATGSNPRKLGITGEAALSGKGVSYCATCDGPLFKGKDIVVVGGGDTAVGEALYLTRFVKKLTLVHRRNALRATKILQDRLLNDKKIAIKWNCVASQILGTSRVEGVRIKDVKTGNEEEIPTAGVFVFAGIEPGTNFLKNKIKLDDGGFIITNENMETSVAGVFACGDARKNALKQVVTACSEGAQAAYSCSHYLEGLL